MIQFVEHVFLKQNPAIFPNLLEAHLELGASIDGIMMMKKTDPGFCKITWVNRLYSPAGLPVPPSCTNCGALSPWSVKPLPHHKFTLQKSVGCHPGKLLNLFINFDFLIILRFGSYDFILSWNPI